MVNKPGMTLQIAEALQRLNYTLEQNGLKAVKAIVLDGRNDVMTIQAQSEGSYMLRFAERSLVPKLVGVELRSE